MATNFFRVFVDDYSFIRGAARLLIAPITKAFPSEISDVIALAPSTGNNDVQTITASGTITAGTFTVTIDTGSGPVTSAAIAFNANAAAIQSAIQAMSNVGSGNATVTGAPISTPTPAVVTFAGALANTLIPLMTVNSGGLTGGTYSAAHTTPGVQTLGLYDAKTGWSDLGATKTGIQITINNAEETFDIDQQLGIIGSQPTTWECSVGTALAESTPERMQIAWQGSAITINNATASTIPEKQIGFGAPNFYIQRRVAVLYQRPSGKIRGYFFRIVQRMPQESSITHAKTGEQQSIPVRFNVLADTAILDPLQQFFMIYDQAMS